MSKQEAKEIIQKELDRRRPGQSKLTSSRNEPDLFEVISGIKNGKTTGGEIKLQVKNVDIRSKDLKKRPGRSRPSHKRKETGSGPF